MKYLALIGTVVAFIFMPAPARADSLIQSFAFSFGDGADVVSGTIFGTGSDRVPGFNWTATSIVITSMPALMESAWFGNLDLAHNLQGRRTTNQWNVIDNELVSGAFDTRAECILDCGMFRLRYDRGLGDGLIFGARATVPRGIYEQYTEAGSLTILPVPEPATVVLLATGAVGLFARRRRQPSLQGA